MEKIYFCEASFLNDYLNKIENASAEDKAMADSLFSSTLQTKSIMTTDGDTAYISIGGPLSRSGPSVLDLLFGYGGTSYNEIIESLNNAEEDDSINKIVLLMDTPGGEVAGVDKVWQTLAACKKKLIAKNQDLIASAGYYIASACNKIVATDPNNRFGSIGVVISMVDYSSAYERAGIVVKEVTSRRAPNKRPDIKTKEGVNVIKSMADEFEDNFYARISEGRKVSIEKIEQDYGQGGILLSDKALKNGMIDELDYDNIVSVLDNSNDNEYNLSAQSEDDIDSTPEGENMEERNMNLDEFLASNPDAKARFDSAIATARAEGVEAGKQESQSRIDAVLPYIDKPEYKGINALAKEVLSGKAEVSALKGAITAFDMMTQQRASAQAQEDTENIGETAPAMVTPSKSGFAESVDDIAAMANADKGVM